MVICVNCIAEFDKKTIEILTNDFMKFYQIKKYLYDIQNKQDNFPGSLTKIFNEKMNKCKISIHQIENVSNKSTKQENFGLQFTPLKIDGEKLTNIFLAVLQFEVFWHFLYFFKNS